APAPPAAGASGLRDLARDSAERHRLLSRAPPRGHREPRAAEALPDFAARRVLASVEPQAPRPAPPPSTDPRADPRSRTRASRPLQHDGARARSRVSARRPDVRLRPQALPARDENRVPADLRRAGD